MPKVTANPAEQRQGLRKSAVHEQICIVELGADRSAMLLDISELGLGVQCVQGIPEGPTTSFRFLLPGSPAIVTGEGEIAWSDMRGRMGIRFTQLAPEMKQEVQEWVNSDANPLFEDAVEGEAVVDEDARDRVAQLEARIMMSGWAEVQSLNFLVDQVAAMTQASGVAIAVEDGNGIMCKASSGIAPQVGVRINSRSGLSWECARTGDVVHCVDTETDPRVDRMVCRELSMRSAMLVPVIRNGRVTGLVEVFSSRPRAFSTNTIILLKRVAEAVGALDELSGILDVEEPLIPPEPVPQTHAHPAEARPAISDHPVKPAVIPAVTVAPSGTAAAAKPALDPITAPVKTEPIIRPAAQAAPPAAAAKEAPRPLAVELPKKPVPAPVAQVATVEIPKPAPVAVRPTPPVPSVAPAPMVRPAASAAPAAITPVGASSSAAAPTKVPAPPPAVAKPVMAGPAVAPVPVRIPEPGGKSARVIEKVAPKIERPAAPVTAKPAAIAEKPAPSAEYVPELFSDTLRPQRRPSKLVIGIAVAVVVVAVGGYEGGQWFASRTTPETRAAQTTQPAITPAAGPVANLPAPPAAAPASPAPKQSATTAPARSNVTVPVATTAATLVAKTPVRQPVIAIQEPSAPMHVPIPRQVQTQVSPAPNTPAPIPAPSSSGMPNLLSESAVVPTLSRAEISRGVSGGKQISRIDPQYPANARSMRIFGTVVLRAHVSKTGTVTSVDVVSGNPLLTAPAVAAVRRWRYQPFLLNGEPIENVVTVQIKFNEP